MEEEKKDPEIRVNVTDHEDHDHDRPTMSSFLIVEGFKWGGAAIAVYVIASFILGFFGPAFGRLFSFLSWLFFGDQPPAS